MESVLFIYPGSGVDGDSRIGGDSGIGVDSGIVGDRRTYRSGDWAHGSGVWSPWT